MKSSSLTENHRLWVSIIQLARAMHKARKAELNKCGLSNAEAAILFFVLTINSISDRDPTVTEISRLSLRSHASISEILSRMQKKGLVEKLKDPNRKRAVRVIITEQARTLYEQSFSEGTIDRILSCLSDKERRQLLVILRKLQDGTSGELETTEPPFPQFLLGGLISTL